MNAISERIALSERDPAAEASTTAPGTIPDPIPLPDVRRVLVTKLRHIGDVLLASPVFSTLARTLPAAEVDALVYLGTEQMLIGHPAIAHVHTIDRNWKRQGLAIQAREEWRLLRKLQTRQFDLLIHLTDHPRGPVLARFLRPRWSVGPERTSHARLWRGQFTHCYRQPLSGGRHTVDSNLDALCRVGIYPNENDKRLVLKPGAEAHARASMLLAQHGLPRGGFILLHPGSRWLFKCWPIERTAALIDRIVEDGWDVVLTGAPDDREAAMTAAILSSIKPTTRRRTVDFTKVLTLAELASVTERARAFVGVDSAPMHIAAAMGTPTIALFGPTSEVQWGPWQVASRIVASTAHPCRPCGIDGCGGGKVSQCLNTLPVDRVFAELHALLAETAVEL